MILGCKRPALIVEGAGDKAAAPRLIREIYQANGIYDVNPAPRPQASVDVRKLKRAGELERYVQYAARHDVDSVLLFLDCEDFEPAEVAADFIPRVRAANVDAKFGLILLKAEFETLFLHCRQEITEMFPDYLWNRSELDLVGDIERIRDAKGVLSKAMKERAYKPTRDQEKFVGALDFELLRTVSPSFVRLERTLLWLASEDETDPCFFDIA